MQAFAHLRTGTVDDLRAKAAAVASTNPAQAARILGQRRPYVAPKVHRIVVDCATGRRKVESEIKLAPAAAPPKAPPAPPPIKSVPNPVPAERGGHNAASIAESRNTDRIVAMACRIWGLERYLFDDRTRVQKVAYVRFAVGLFIRRQFQWSSVKIGRSFNRDHTSAMHWYKKGAVLLDGDPEWAARYTVLEATLLGHQPATVPK